MLASTIIVLREMLEMCLVIGMISAALDNMPKKWSILCLGIAAGLIFSSSLAFFFYKASDFFVGSEQEYINIIILSASIIFIALTMLWINDSVKALKNRIQAAHLSGGVFPIIMVIALSVAREGAELILFMHGVAAGGAKSLDLIFGFILGSILGISLGIVMYKGLLKIPSKYFFKTINVMLTLLAAGMAAQLANYLNAADLIKAGSNSLWDSSWLITDSSLIGKILHGLLGYSSQPTMLQGVFYVTTLALLTLILQMKRKS